MKKIKKGDQIIVISGRDKGKIGEVLQILQNDRALVNDVNLVKKHTKPNPSAGITGGILTKEASIHISNISLYNESTKKADKVRIESNDNERYRVFKSDGSRVDT